MTSFVSIIAATDFSVDGNNAVRRAALLARQHDAQLTVLHVVDDAALKGVQDWFSAPLDIATRVAQAQQRNVDLLATGRRQRSKLADMLLGSSISHRMLTRSRCDMLIVPGDRGAHLPSGFRSNGRGIAGARLAIRKQPLAPVYGSADT